MNPETNKNTTPYAVAVLFSNWPLRQICAFLEDEVGGNRDQVGVMRIDRTKGKETNRTIMLIDRALLEAAEQKGFTHSQRGLDFKMTEYELRDHNRPKEGYTRNFYIPLPDDLPVSDANAQLENKIDVLCTFGMFPKNRPRVKIPLVSRESEKHRGRSFITFARESDDDEVALARVLLHDTKLYTGENDYTLMKCFWAKERSPPSSPRDKNKGKSKKEGNNGPQKGKSRTKGAQKKPRKSVPAKKNLEKDTPTVPAVAKPVVVPALEPGENKWDKPLTGLAPLPPLNAETVSKETTPETSESPKEVTITEDTPQTDQAPPTGLDFPPLH